MEMFGNILNKLVFIAFINVIFIQLKLGITGANEQSS
jgi:hypothetical protein